MPTVKTAELEGAQLDWAVAKANGRDPSIVERKWAGRTHWCRIPNPHRDGEFAEDWLDYSPSIEWRIAGPIIERERITLVCLDDGRWMSGKCSGTPTSPLIAAMRAFVASKLGDEVEVP